MLKRIVHLVFWTASLLSLASCVQQLPAPEGPGEHTISLTLDGSLQPYADEQGTKAASALTWKAGDIIYVRVETTSGANTSYAQYNADGSWTFNYTGSLSASSRVRCCFIEKPRGTDAYQVALSYTSAVYEDPAATLTIEGSSAKLSTYLKPKSGRISFHGGSKSIKLTGLSWYSAFDLESFTFTETLNAYVGSFQASATNYFYGFFDDENANREIFITSENLIYKRSFGEQVLRAGASGYVDVPTHTDYEAKGWTLTNEDELIRYQPIVFEDDNFKAWLLQQGYDKDGDGEISYAEGEKVTEIVNEGNTTVTSLKGIERFPNLKKLRWTGTYHWEASFVPEGKLTSVDLSGNPKLEEVNLNYNQLTGLDISANPNLRQLHLFGNLIENLSLGGGSNLQFLDCSTNKLSSLDLSGFPNLSTLQCYQNQITSLDLSVCPKLMNIDIETNQLTSLDVSSLTELRSLYCANNKLSAIDVSHNSKLTNLWVSNNTAISSIDISHCPELTYLGIGRTSITSIDLSVCPDLVNFNCSGCQLPDLDFSYLSKLQYLYCDDCGWTSLDLSNNTQLTDLSCAGNDVGDALVISNCSKLRWLQVSNMGLTSLDLWNMPQLETLYCSHNDFSGSGLDLAANTNLRYLTCGQCHLSTLDVSSNLKLENLECWTNELTELDVYANSNLSRLNTLGNPSLVTILVKTGHTFPNGLDYDSTTEIVYQD